MTWGDPTRCNCCLTARSSRTTPGRFRTRIVTEGVTPSINVYYKNTRVKQYHKEGRALRTETTINNTWDFRIGKRLHNLPKLREIGFSANRRMLQVERVSHDCILAEETFRALNGPVEVNGQRALHCASPIPKFRHSGTAWSCSGFKPTISVMRTCAATGPR